MALPFFVYFELRPRHERREDGRLALSQLYRDRGDCENNFDEFKNQWGWSGFTTHKLKSCRTRIVESGRKRIIHLTSTHAESELPHNPSASRESRADIVLTVSALTRSPNSICMRRTRDAKGAEERGVFHRAVIIPPCCTEVNGFENYTTRIENWVA